MIRSMTSDRVAVFSKWEVSRGGMFACLLFFSFSLVI